MVVRTHLTESAIWHHKCQSNLTVADSKNEETVGPMIIEIFTPKQGSNYPICIRTKYFTFYYYLVAV